MDDRKPLSKKVRFDVFKRDLFTCQYCGRTPPVVVLEVDHIHPVSQGGGNERDNLLTACFDCNRGKGSGLLSAMPDTIVARTEVLAEKEAQMRAYARLRKKAEKLMEAAIDEVEQVFSKHNSGMVFSAHFRLSVKTFIEALGIDAVCWSMNKACVKKQNPDQAIKYFCGICWNKIRGDAK